MENRKTEDKSSFKIIDVGPMEYLYYFNTAQAYYYKNLSILTPIEIKKLQKFISDLRFNVIALMSHDVYGLDNQEK